MKKILVISPIPTHPQNAGNRARVFTLMSSIKESGHDVFFCHIKREEGDERAMRRHWGSDHFFPLNYHNPTSSLTERIVRKLTSYVNKEVAFVRPVDHWYDTSVDRSIKLLSRETEFDVVITEYVFFSKALNCFDKGVLKVVDTHDVFTDRHKAYLANRQRPTWFSTTARQESKGLNRADVVIAIQQGERDFFTRITTRKVINVGHIVPLYEPRKPHRPNQNILFVGSATSINLHSVRYFIRNIWPAVRRQLPHTKLLLAGKVGQFVEETEGLIRLGELEDLRVAYDMADLVVTPLLFGTGLKIKTIEALGYSKPLVTTSIGAEGLERGIGEAFLVCDDPKDFARSVFSILSDSQLHHRLSQNACDFARKYNKENLRELQKLGIPFTQVID